MFLEGEVNWVLVLGVIAAVSVAVALIALWFAITDRVRHVNASDQLDLVQRVAEAADKRLFQTLNAIPVALVETDKQGKFVFANRAAHQLLGRRDAELIGLRFHSATWGVTYPDGRAIPPDLLPSARALRGQTVKGFQHLLANPATRRKMLVSVTAMPIQNAVGEVIGSSAAIVETEGLSTPQTARDDDDIARRYFDLAGVMLLALDAEGRVRDLNAAGAAILGLPAADVVGQEWIERFVPEDERGGARRFLKKVIEGKAEMPDGESWIIRGDGKRRLIAWKGAVARDAQDNFIATLSTGRDITDERVAGYQDQEFTQTLEQKLAEATTALAASEEARRKTEQVLAQAQRLETAGRLTGGAAQDFDRLLSVVGGALETLVAQAENPELVRRLGQAALVANRKGEHLSRQLIALTQPRAEDLTQVDVDALIRSFEPALTRAAGRAPLALNLSLDAGQARLDVEQFEAALVNLVKNAGDAVAAGGAVTIGGDQVQVAEGQVAGLKAGRYARVFVMDTGVGMNAETAARAPEVFFTTKPPALHPGLGLAQVFGFARHAGGAAELQTEPGRGTTVSLYLPLAG